MTKPWHYYNEIDPYAAQWLRNLIDAGHLPDGVVDGRSIEDVSPRDLHEFTQCHFFAGAGGWPLALRLAGWPDDRPVWTGSCPCQPFSTAGKGKGFADERHLWPSFHWLISERRPPTVFGEQVASKNAELWLDLVQADLEALGYALGAIPFPAAGVGATHIRDRMYWVADTDCAPGKQRREPAMQRGREDYPQQNGMGGSTGWLGNPDGARRQSEPHVVRSVGEGMEQRGGGTFKYRETSSGAFVGMAHAEHDGGRADEQERQPQGGTIDGGHSAGLCRDATTGPTNGFWRDADWLLCRDGKWRPVEPGTFPLAHGVPARVGRLRAYGNAIVPQAAAAFVKAYLDALA